jgi:hypothetical protein
MNDTNVFKLSGFVAEFPLLEVIQFLGMNQKNGHLCISLENENESISLYIKQGMIMHAVFDEIEGIEAFHAILQMETGYFKFIAGEQAPKMTINMPVSVLLLESQRRADELNHLQTQLPPDDMVLFLVPDLEEVPPLDTFEWRVISMVNGRRNIQRICQKIGDELAVKQTVLKLLSRGLVSTVSEDAAWKTLTPRPLPSGELKADRPYPPLLRTNLLLKTIDGKSDLKTLMSRLNMKESDLLEDIKLLHDTQWIKFSTGEEKAFSRLKNEI